jgi:hypothetical protein
LSIFFNYRSRLGFNSTHINSELQFQDLQSDALMISYTDAIFSPVQPRLVAFDRLISLVLYFVAATCIADIVGFALRSLLAVGGISGNILVNVPLCNLTCIRST